MMRVNDRSVTVDRLKLIEKLKENLEQHRQDHIEAMIGYRVKLKKDLEAALDFFDERSDEDIAKLSINFAVPRSYAKEYTDAIAMLEWSTQDVVELDHALFKQYVQNEWTWSGAFDTITSTYKTFAASASTRR